jgi:hypothetical protein
LALNFGEQEQTSEASQSHIVGVRYEGKAELSQFFAIGGNTLIAAIGTDEFRGLEQVGESLCFASTLP